ncbi:ferric reductase-like transmembrane domain-containing protein [Mangrovibacterium lignilyticum]|uniref:ferric reductase-like transmembrane domain-containing protein n=1 Tax=Mangrovibacterium lignilyticum TaxID=2668052 RepID=UPI0013D64049|nr:ferric reductase-like transmembrane domain-containing protein [Mangrovibacterium lignilyticum]
MNWIKSNWNWMLVVIIGFLPLTGILAMINLDFSSSADSWISMDSLTVPGRNPGDAPRIISGAHMAVKETGEWAIRWLVAILSLSPIAILTGIKSRLYVRQTMGITAFVYAALHFLFFCIDKSWVETFKEFGFVLGLLATLVMLVLAITSNRKSMRYLRKKWKKLHRMAYLAGFLAVLHVVLLEHGSWAPYLAILVVGFILRTTFVKSKISRLRTKKTVEYVTA